MTNELEPVHYTAEYLVNPQHPVTINVIGCGGTGSQILNSLARMHSALKALGHPGLFVRAIDNDKVSTANMGRQLFSMSDVGAHKCTVLVGRINRFFGTDWEAVPNKYQLGSKIPTANITISCVDSGASRAEIYKVLVESSKMRHEHPYTFPLYWMDYGNMKDRGQVVIGTVVDIKQPKDSKGVSKLKTINKIHPEIFKDKKGDDQGPSCSLAEALDKQDLFINTNLANMGLGILWKMFRELRIQYHGLYLNLETMQCNPIRVWQQ